MGGKQFMQQLDRVKVVDKVISELYKNIKN